MTAVPPRPPAPEPVKGRYELTPLGWVLIGAGEQSPAAPDATAGDGLREIQSQLYALLGDRTSDAAGDVWRHWSLRRFVSDVLALPALRDVLAAAARDAETVRRVEELASEWVAYAPLTSILRDAGRLLRRALDPS